MSTMTLSTLFSIFKILNFLKKKCKCTTLFQNAEQHKRISRSPQYPRKRSRPRPPVTFILRPWWPSLWFQKDKPVCSRLKQCWFSLWTGWFLRMGGKVPLTGSIPVSLPEPADSAGMMQDAGCRMCDAGCRMQAELGPELPTRSVQRRQGCQPWGLQPRCLPRSMSPAVRFYKEKEHIKNRRGKITKQQLSVTKSKCWFQHII